MTFTPVNRTRKPVSISTTSIIENGEVVYLTNAVCDDGTIWELTDVAEGWKKLPSIPGTKEANKEKYQSNFNKFSNFYKRDDTKGFVSDMNEPTKASFCDSKCKDCDCDDSDNVENLVIEIDNEEQFAEQFAEELEILLSLFLFGKN